jgi:hypothetical protein
MISGGKWLLYHKWDRRKNSNSEYYVQGEAMTPHLNYELPPSRAGRSAAPWLFVIVILIIVGGAGVMLRSWQNGSAGSAEALQEAKPPILTANELIELAETLERNQIYSEAARAWEDVARSTKPVGHEKAEILFRIGKNHHLAGEHEKALTYLFAAESADAEERWKESINKLVLESLSALGREDVRAYQAGKRLNLDDKSNGQEGKIVAEIGGEAITEQELQVTAKDLVTQQLAPQKAYLPQKKFDEAVEQRLEQFQTPEGRQQLLQMVISRELLYREALANDLDEDEQVRRNLIDARQRILTRVFVDHYLDKNLKITKTDLENAYAAHKGKYVEPEAVKVDALVVDNEESKAEVNQALQSPETDFAELQEQYSLQQEDGEEQEDVFDRWITRDGWVPLVKDGKAVRAHLFALDTGQVSDNWFETTDGKFVRFRLREHRAERTLPLAQCKEQVKRDLRNQKQQELIEQLRQSLRNKYQVVVHDEQEKVATTQPKNHKKQ